MAGVIINITTDIKIYTYMVQVAFTISIYLLCYLLENKSSFIDLEKIFFGFICQIRQKLSTHICTVSMYV